MSKQWPFGSWLDRHPRIAVALLVGILILWTGVDGLLDGVTQ